MKLTKTYTLDDIKQLIFADIKRSGCRVVLNKQPNSDITISCKTDINMWDYTVTVSEIEFKVDILL